MYVSFLALDVLFLGYSCYGEIHCYLCFLFHYSLIHIYELFMIYVFVLCFVKSRIYFYFTCIFHTCVDSVVLLSTLATDE